MAEIVLPQGRLRATFLKFEWSLLATSFSARHKMN
jgi:hypothetical protein